MEDCNLRILFKSVYEFEGTFNIFVYFLIKMDLYLIYHTKINSRHIKDLNVINKVIKLIENNIKKNFMISQ